MAKAFYFQALGALADGATAPTTPRPSYALSY
jgi:hypothetical protein